MGLKVREANQVKSWVRVVGHLQVIAALRAMVAHSLIPNMYQYLANKKKYKSLIEYNLMKNPMGELRQTTDG